MEEEVACVDLSPMDEKTGLSSLIGVGLWTDISVRILNIPDLQNTHTEKLMGGKFFKNQNNLIVFILDFLLFTYYFFFSRNNSSLFTYLYSRKSLLFIVCIGRWIYVLFYTQLRRW